MVIVRLDDTHKTVLTGRLLEQVAMQAGFSMEGSYNTIRIHGKKRRVKTIFKYLLRDFLEWALTNLYFGERIPWDCSITCVLVKK